MCHELKRLFLASPADGEESLLYHLICEIYAMRSCCVYETEEKRRAAGCCLSGGLLRRELGALLRNNLSEIREHEVVAGLKDFIFGGNCCIKIAYRVNRESWIFLACKGEKNL